jgi:hypothetical protein
VIHYDNENRGTPIYSLEVNIHPKLQDEKKGKWNNLDGPVALFGVIIKAFDKLAR